NKLINRNYLRVRTTELSNDTLETLKILENCTGCKDKKIDGNDLDEFYKSANKIENFLAELEKEEQGKKKGNIIDELFEINIRLNKAVLCEGCKVKKIKNLTDKCGNA